MNWIRGETGWRLLPGGATALFVAPLLKLGMWAPLEQLSYQALFRLGGPIAWDSRVVVVAIDDASLTALGRFAWSRQRYAQLLHALTKDDASVVAFDLLICRTIVQQHGGQIWVESELGKGCTFCLTVPIAQADVLAAT